MWFAYVYFLLLFLHISLNNFYAESYVINPGQNRLNQVHRSFTFGTYIPPAAFPTGVSDNLYNKTEWSSNAKSITEGVYPDKSKFFDKVFMIKEWLEKVLRTRPSLITFTGQSLGKMEEILSEAFLFEDLFDHFKLEFKISGNSSQADYLNQLRSKLWPYIQNKRKKIATERLKILLASLLRGPDIFDEHIREFSSDYTSTCHLLGLIDEKIKEANLYFEQNQEERISENLMKIIRERIKAENYCKNDGKINFIRALSRCTQEISKEDAMGIIKKEITSLEDLEDFTTWIEDGIEFLEKSEKSKIETIKRMKGLLVIIQAINPLRTES